MSPKTWIIKTNLREAEVERLADEFKRRISELHMKIRSGTLTSAELEAAQKELAAMKGQMEDQLKSATKEDTSRRVRETEERRAQGQTE